MDETLSNYECIYIRLHESYEKYNACKVGKTLNIPERDSLYTTGEIKRGILFGVGNHESAGLILN